MLKTFMEFWRSAFSTPTIIDDVTQRTHKASAEMQHCESLIEKATFQRHMAICELVALEMWNHGKVYTAMPEINHKFVSEP